MTTIYMTDDTRNALVQAISRNGVDACTLLEASAGQEDGYNHPMTYIAGYLQGYVHATDRACEVVDEVGR